MTRKLTTLLALFLVAVGASATDLARGTVIEKLVCANQPDQAYSLYLPSAYTPDRQWPILYAFDARRDGKGVTKRFKQAAETFGCIGVSSLGGECDVEGHRPIYGNLASRRALWAYTHARLS